MDDKNKDQQQRPKTQKDEDKNQDKTTWDKENAGSFISPVNSDEDIANPDDKPEPGEILPDDNGLGPQNESQD